VFGGRLVVRPSCDRSRATFAEVRVSAFVVASWRGLDWAFPCRILDLLDLQRRSLGLSRSQ
jgi:hypothetical protein